MGLVVNFDIIQSGSGIDKLVGRAGWWALASEPWVSVGLRSVFQWEFPSYADTLRFFAGWTTGPAS